MVPITEENNGDLHIAPTGQKPSGIAAWLGENFSTGIMIAAAVGAVATIFFAPTIAATVASGGGAHWGLSALLPSIPSWITTVGSLAVGGLIGASMDKRQNEKNAVEGVTIKKPGFFNRGILTEGLLKGGLNGLVMGVGLGVMLLGSMLLPMVGITALSIGSLGVTGTAIVGAIGAAIGAVRGSISRKEKMDKVYGQVKTAYLIQTGQVEKARGLMQTLGVAGPVAAAGIGIGASGLAAAGSAKASVIDPATIKTVAGAVAGTHDALTHEEQYLQQAQQQPVASANAYDFSHMGEAHPAAQAQRSFLEAEAERRAALGQRAPTIH